MSYVVLQRLREKVLLVVSPVFKEHIGTLTEVSQCLREAGLSIGLKNSNFCF